MKTAAFAIVILAGAGCMSQPPPRDDVSRGPELITVNQEAAGRLYRGVADTRRTPAPILVTGFADGSDLGRSSALGRLIAAHMASHLQQIGVPTVLLPLTLPIFVERVPGEHVISPEIKAIATARGFERLALGTYAVAAAIVYVHARIVEVANSRILASHEYTLPLSPDVERLLAQP